MKSNSYKLFHSGTQNKVVKSAGKAKAGSSAGAKRSAAKASSSRRSASAEFSTTTPALRNTKKTVVSSSVRKESTAPVRTKSGNKLIGLWDLDARVAELDRLISDLNKYQDSLQFFEIDAPVPSGMVVKPSDLSAWFEKRGVKLKASKLDENLLDTQLEKYATTLRKKWKLDVIVCLTSYKIAGYDEADDSEPQYFDLYSSSFSNIIFVSTANLQDVAKAAKKPFIKALAYVLIAQLLAELSPELDFHDKKKGCMFDADDGTKQLSMTLRTPDIHPKCRALIPRKYQAATDAFLSYLRK